nr:Spy/CpxP family protein refolding chaperone [Neisseria perflava]
MLIRYIVLPCRRLGIVVSAVLKSPFFIQLLIALPLLLSWCGLTQAAPRPQLDDFYPNCDIRQLNLSQDQHNALRRIRTEYKQASDRASRKTQRTDRTRRQSIIKILANDSFDQNAARDYVESRYLSSMDFAVEELAIQHRFYHILNGSQRQQWLSNCLR